MNISNFWQTFFLIFFLFSCGSNVENETDNSYDVSQLELIAKIAFGSCTDEDEPQALWDEVIDQNPDVWIWLGDIIYGDTEDMELFKAKYDKQKSNALYQEIINSMPVYGIWDDHDYGANNAGKEYPKKKETRDLMFEFLDLDLDDPAWSREGGYQSHEFSVGALSFKLILLDSRYFRDRAIKVGGKYQANLDGTILGEEQWSWFEEEMTNSKADINLIANGIQVIPQDHKYEKWFNFPNERERLFDVIAKSGASNPILMSGDRHISELSKIEQVGIDIPLYDITSSGLSHAWHDFPGEPNRHRVGEVIHVLSFGQLEIYKSNEGGILTKLKFIGEENLVLAEYDLF